MVGGGPSRPPKPPVKNSAPSRAPAKPAPKKK